MVVPIIKMAKVSLFDIILVHSLVVVYILVPQHVTV
jgi:hypothetical protein